MESEDEDEDGNEVRRRGNRGSRGDNKYKREMDKEVERFKVKVSQTLLFSLCQMFNVVGMRSFG